MWRILELTAMIRSLMMEGMSVPAAAAATRDRKTRSFILFKFFVGPRTLEEGLRRAFGKDLPFIHPTLPARITWSNFRRGPRQTLRLPRVLRTLALFGLIFR